jgi:hypothetical protein
VGSENDGINLVLIAGALFVVLLVCGFIGSVVWMYSRQSAKRRTVGAKASGEEQKQWQLK